MIIKTFIFIIIITVLSLFAFGFGFVLGKFGISKVINFFKKLFKKGL